MVVRTQISTDAAAGPEEALPADECISEVEEVEVEPVDEETGIAVMERLGDVDARAWLIEVRSMVEAALIKQQETISVQEEQIRDQGTALARLKQELRHHSEMEEAREALVNETARRMKATNRNLRTALEERDRRLTIFARKLARVRVEKDGNSTARSVLVDELRRLSWFQRKRRKVLLEQLEAGS